VFTDFLRQRDEELYDQIVEDNRLSQIGMMDSDQLLDVMSQVNQGKVFTSPEENQAILARLKQQKPHLLRGK